MTSLLYRIQGCSCMQSFKNPLGDRRLQNGIQNVTEQSSCITNALNNLTEMDRGKDAALEKLWK